MPDKAEKEKEIPLGELADEHDTLDWDINKHGRFKDYVDKPPKTELWLNEEDKNYGLPDNSTDKA